MSEVSNHPKLSLVVLCYRAGEGARLFVRELIKELEHLHDGWEIILVGNYFHGDNDPTPQILHDIAESSGQTVRVVADHKKGMMGWDVRSGLAIAKGEYLAFIDGDGQMPVRDLSELYKVIRTGDFDLVKTYREERYDGWRRRVISKVYNWLFIIFFPGYPVKDVNSKPKIMTRLAYEKMELSSDDWFIDAEIIIKARRYKLKLYEVPTVFLKNVRRKSFVKNSAVFEFVKNMIKARIKEFRY